MEDKQPSLIRRFFRGFWTTLNFTRTLTLNFTFLIFILLLLSTIFSNAIKLQPNTALVISPKGKIVEQYTADATDRAFANLFGDKIHEVQLRDILHAIDASAKDSRIKHLVIIPDQITSAGISTLREIGAAIDNFKKTGKKVFAISNGMSQKEYYLASHADQVFLHPEGGLLIEGLGRYQNYYKDALDKLAVDVHVFRVGEYKSAVEPFILNKASREAREADLFWMNDVWSHFLVDIGKQRNIETAVLFNTVNQFPELLKEKKGDLAEVALKQKLVDKLMTRDQARDFLITQGEKDEENKTFRQIDLKNYVALLEHETLPVSSGDKIAVVVAEGEIVGGDQPPGMVGGDSTARLIRKAREDEDVKAIVLRVNSPGGEVFASEVIRREVELTKGVKKPIVVSMGNVAASGGYWISMNADEIWAEPTTITGSIGIFGLFMSIPNTLAKIGVHTDGVGTTPLAGAFDARLPLDPRVGEMIQTVIDKGYRDFITRVAKARNKTPEEIDTVARGRVWSGSQAKERGLVDQLGGLNDAIVAAAKRATLDKNYHIDYVEKELTPWQHFLLSFSNEAHAYMGKAFDLGLPKTWIQQEELRQQLKLLKTLDSDKIGVFAYCFCEVK